MKVPIDMTSEKLRQVAACLDLLNTFLNHTNTSDPELTKRMREFGRSTEMNDDLRRWADEIERKDVVGIGPSTTCLQCGMVYYVHHKCNGVMTKWK